jgi:uncharacterized repeat protein (TIGR03803 family)
MNMRAGNNYVGTTVALAAALCAVSILAQQEAAAATPTTIWSFTGTVGDGQYPSGPVIFDSGGAMYGTTEVGGTSSSGTVFKLAPPPVAGGAWTESVLYSFGGGSDGRQPSTGVVFDSSGALYGTTYDGGTINNYGTVFQLTPPAAGSTWNHSVIYTFQGVYDGQNPGAVVFRNGLLYGTTPAGGPASPPCNRIGCGTVFELAPPGKKGSSWTKTVLYSFPGSLTDGRSPNSDIVFDSNGALYGTTDAGGTSNYGTVFQLTPPAKAGGSWTYKVLHNFTGGSDGGYPIGGLVVGSNGALYGTASYSGVANDSGTAFQLTPPARAGGAWSYSVIHTFAGGKDGATPASTPVFDTSGNLYGTTWSGGSSACYTGCGTIFKLAPPSGGGAWSETVLYAWPSNPQSSIVVFKGGLLYGTTFYLGAANVGSVFELAP